MASTIFRGSIKESVAAVAAVDPNLFILDAFDYFLTADEGGDEGEIVAGDDPAALITAAIKYTLSDMGGGIEHTYRVYDDDGNHVASVSLHTLVRLANEWGIDIDRAMRDVVELNF